MAPLESLVGPGSSKGGPVEVKVPEYDWIMEHIKQLTERYGGKLVCVGKKDPTENYKVLATNDTSPEELYQITRYLKEVHGNGHDSAPFVLYIPTQQEVKDAAAGKYTN